MKIKIKRIFVIALTVLLIISSAPLQGFTEIRFSLPEIDFSLGSFKSSAANELTEGFYTYTVNNNEATIVSVSATVSGEISVPETLGSCNVVSIGASAFKNCTLLTGVSLPDTVKIINSSAFEGCANLGSIDLNKVEKIGARVFKDCTRLTSITIPATFTEVSGTYNGYGTFYQSSIETAVFEEGIAHIPANTFSGCTSLISVTIPEKEDTDILGGYIIKNSAFKECSSLSAVDLPDSLTKIEYCAFEGCSSLASVEITDNITELGNYCFKGCSNLESVIFGDSLSVISADCFENCVKLLSVTLTDSVKTIHYNAFAGCSRLETVNLNKVEKMGACVFEDCTRLTSITIPATFTEVSGTYNGYGTFCQSSIETAVFEKGIAHIPANTFSGCATLKKTYIPVEAETVNNKAFKDCTALSDVYYQGSEDQWADIVIGNDNNPLLNATIHYNHTHSDENADLMCDVCDYNPCNYNDKVTSTTEPVTEPSTEPTTTEPVTEPTTTKPTTTKPTTAPVVTKEPVTKPAPTTKENITKPTKQPIITKPTTTQNDDEFEEGDFDYVLDAPLNVRVKSVTSNTVKLVWDSVEDAESYVVYYSVDGKKWKKYKASKAYSTVKKLESATSYKFKVAAVSDGETGEESEIITVTTKPDKVIIKSVRLKSSSKMIVIWTTLKNVSGYEVVYSTSKKFTKKTTKKVTVKKKKAKKIVIKKLKSGKKYFVKIRAYKTVGNKKIYGAYSSVKTTSKK